MNEVATLPEDHTMNDTIQHEPAPEPVAAPHAAPSPEPAATGTRNAQLQTPRQPFDPREKSPRLAAVLSAVPGLGQVYIGYYQRGLIFAASMLLLGMAAATASGDIGPVFGFSMFFLWLFNLVDAGRMAALYNHAAAGSDGFELPEDFAVPGVGGSIAGGALLAVFGLISFSNTALGFELDWLEVWWPVLPIGLGLYLIVRGVQER